MREVGGVNRIGLSRFAPGSVGSRRAAPGRVERAGRSIVMVWESLCKVTLFSTFVFYEIVVLNIHTTVRI